MWLINTSTLDLEAFQECPTNTYAILSHTWGSNAEELDFDEFKAGAGRHKLGVQKILGCCELARNENLQYAWIDTCCIDKRSSTELSEAINSMFEWYRCAKICYVYMADVTCHDPPVSPEEPQPFVSSRWFTRGWTLQELIAPQNVVFYTQCWGRIGDKVGLANDLQRVTGIPESVLTLQESFLDCSIAQRMSWASRRSTTRIEDAAYCLIGLFNASMPLLYGEGAKAFLRLQDTILEQTDDETIFAWTGVDRHGSGLLAPSPAHFINSANIRQGKQYRERPPYAKTNRGLSIECELLPCDMNTYVVPLQCTTVLPPSMSQQIAIFICRTSQDDQYRRVSFEGKCIDTVTDWEISKATILKIFVPDEARTLELMPHAGLPRIHLESNLYPWLLQENKLEALRHSQPAATAVAINDIEAGGSKSGNLGHSGSSEHSPIETTPIQFQRQDLADGKVIQFKRSATIKAPFYYQLQIGFDTSFNPTCILRVRSRRLPHRWLQNHIKSGPRNGQIISAGLKSVVSRSSSSLTIWTFRGNRYSGFEKDVNFLLPLGFGCTTFRIELHPRHGLEWQLTLQERTYHAGGHWEGALCSRRLYQTLFLLYRMLLYLLVYVGFACGLVALLFSLGVLKRLRSQFDTDFNFFTLLVLLMVTSLWLLSCMQLHERIIHTSQKKSYDCFHLSWRHNKEAMELFRDQERTNNMTIK